MRRFVIIRTIITAIFFIAGLPGLSRGQPAEEKRISMNFPKTDIKIALDALSREIDTPIVSDVALSGEISIISKNDLTIEEAIAAFNSALRAKDLAIIRTDKLIRIVKIDEAKRDNVKVEEGMEPSLILENDEIITQIMRLENIDVDAARDAIAKLVNARYGDISLHVPTNTIIVTDISSNVKRLAKILSSLDTSPAPAKETRVYRLKYALAEEIKGLLGQLDSKTSEGGFFFGGNKLQERVKDEIVRLRGAISVQADKETNSLIISSYPGNFPSIEKIIAKFDKLRPQVLIEAMICEYSLDNEDTFGMEWEYAGKTDIGTKKLNLELAEEVAGFKYSLVDAQGGRLDYLMFALSQKEYFNVLSSPRMLTKDGKQAVITVGKSVPIIESRTLVSAATETTTAEYDYSYKYQDVGIKLTVTPRIHSPQEASLQIAQEVKSLTSETLFGSPIILQRNAEAEVLVRNNQMVVIGGLMKDDRRQVVKKVPFLGDIPLLGVFFKKTTWITEKTELLVFLRPRIIFNPKELIKLSRDQKAETRDLLLPEDRKPPSGKILGKITRVFSDNKSIIDLGGINGIKKGMRLNVYDGKRSLSRIGIVTVEEVYPCASVVRAKRVIGNQKFRKGYIVCLN